MKMKTTHLAHRKSKRITMMLIPNHPGKIRKLTYPAWLPKTFSLVLALLITVLSVSTHHFAGSLKETRQALIAEKITVAELEETKRIHLGEIDQLKEQFMEIDGRLARLNELENKVLHMVGLETPEATVQDPSAELLEHVEEDYFSRQFLLVSRSGDTVSRSSTTTNVDYEVDVEMLNQLVENQTSQMIQLVSDVESQLEYLDAQPNLWPAGGRITSPFGNRISPTNRRRTEFHQGIDIANSTGTAIVAAGSGIVTYSGYNGGYGRMVIVSHGYGYTSVYAHNSQNLVSVGDRVEKGDRIALMGRTGRATGTHLHFEIRVHGDPIDPQSILQ